MNLSEREQAFLDEIRRVFPDAREIKDKRLEAAETVAIEYPVQPVAALTLWEG